ncbi:TPA: omptin family outer membrane protease [Salmonella enterica subsp. diarizonae serovar 61:l,v:z35]|uniref:omptin family outer membrane protease n=1 Tax=Citrobacter werkmanii TaxID=67827 RepID=UPI0012C54E26|nr:omptin family outer membrane protease [Salmonella enterica subsp. enterica serovar Newport]
MKIISGVVLLGSGILMTAPAMAAGVNDDDGILDASEKAVIAQYFTPEKVTVGMSVGTLSGQAKERVYDGQRRLSQLDWKFKNAAILKGYIDWDVSPWVRLAASGWITAGSHGASDMVDRDWTDPGQGHYTDISTSPTRLNSASLWDVNATLWALHGENYHAGLMVGWRQNDYKWESHGGYYHYDNGQDVGAFPDQKVIGYKLQFKMPYIGLTGGYRYHNVELNTAFKYSHWVRASDTDEHYLRNITFRDKNRDSDFYSLSADIGYYITPQAKVFIEGEWMRVTNGKGSDTAYFNDSGAVGYSPDASGIESSSYNITAGLRYYF